MGKKKTSESNRKKMKTELGVRVATHLILKELNNGCPQQNLESSPLSLHLCLNLLAAGAKGLTLDQLLRFLNAENVAQLNAQSSLYMELASSSCSGPIVSLVNGIWVDHRFSLKDSFKDLADEIFKSNCQSLDFEKAKKVAKKINAWAKEASKGHIDKLVSSDSLRESVLVLANALYFKGSWIQEFDPLETRDEDFRLLNGKRVRVPFMKQWETKFFYRCMDGLQILKMVYENGEDDKDYAMYVFLPNWFDGLPELVQKFHSDPKYFTRTREFEHVEIYKLWLPKLKYENSLDLAENIKELGLDLPFRKDAGLTEIVHVDGDDKVYVSKTIQKSYIEVNERGTIATSVTAMELRRFCSLRRRPKIDFVADHPFLFMIKEENSRIVLFVGAAFNPLL